MLIKHSCKHCYQSCALQLCLHTRGSAWNIINTGPKIEMSCQEVYNVRNACTSVLSYSTQIVNSADMKINTEAIVKTLLSVQLSINSVRHFQFCVLKFIK